GIRPSEEHALGPKNLLFRKACDNLGISSEPTPRNVVGCQACGECFTGCDTRAKRSMDVTYIPAAIQKGLRVYTSVQVEKVLHRGGAVHGVEARVVDASDYKCSYDVRIDTPNVVMASGCTATPVILQRSAVPDPFKRIGSDLQCHPGAA